MPVAAAIAYRVHHGGDPGSGSPPLVLIHGAGGSSLHWPPHLRRLPDFEVYALDLPGHGDSEGSSAESIGEKALAVVAWQEALALGPCVFAGHSMGGAIVQTLALDHKDVVAGAILIGTGGRLRVNSEILALTANQETFPDAVAAIGLWAFSEHADQRLVELAGMRMLTIPAEAVHADFLACDQFDVLPRLGEISCPTLVICGDQDQLTPPKYSQFLVEQVPDAALHIIQDSGHMVMLEQPERVAASMQEFMRTLG